MAKRVPRLRQHATGVYFVRFGGKDHYLSTDYQESVRQYPALLERWNIREAIKESAKAPEASTRWMHVVRDFLDYLAEHKGEEVEAFYRKHLRRFNGALGPKPIKELSVEHIQALKVGMAKLGLAPKTIKHDLDCVRRLLRWAEDHGKADHINVRGVENPTLLPPLPEPVSPLQVRKLIAKAREADARLEPWLSLNYLVVMRMSEVKRLVWGQGVWLQEGVFVLEKSKMAARTQVRRHLILNAEALEWLGKATKCWPGVNSYYKATVRACGLGGPHVLRDSAYQHLLDRGVPKYDADLLLGHVPPGAWRSYGAPAWQLLREKAALLSLR